MELANIRRRARERRYEIDWEARRYCFVQGDQNIANQAGAAFRSDLNNELQALVTLSSGTSAPSTTYAYQLWADTTTNLLKRRNAANAAWIVVRSLDESFVLSRSSNTILAASDIGKTLVFTSTFTQTFTAAATLADGWWVRLRNDGTGIITLDPNASETIDGATTIALNPGDSCIVNCNGSAFKTVGRTNPTVPAGGVAKNMCYNGSCRILAEAAKSLTTSPLYAKVDSWAAWASGGAVSAGTITQDAAATIGTYGKALHLSGITLTGAGQLSVRQRIPAVDAVFYKNKTCSFSAHALQDTGGAINYTVVIRKPTAADNYSSTSVISTGAAVSVPSTTGTQVFNLGVAMGDCSAGIEIEIQVVCGAITTKNFRFSDMQLEEGSIATEFEYVPISLDKARCGFLFEKTYQQGTDPGTSSTADMLNVGLAGTGTATLGVGGKWTYPKRTSGGTFNYWDGAGNASKVSVRSAGGTTSVGSLGE